MSSSLGQVAHVDQLIVRELGSKSSPVETIHTASTFEFQNDLSFKDQGETKFVIQKNGHLAVSQDVHLYGDSTDIATGTLRYSLGLSADGTKFEIKNEVTNTVVFEADDTGSVQMATVTGLVDALNAKQAKLQVNGADISPTILNTFSLTSGGDGTDYATSLVTAKALEDFIEQVLQPSLLTVQAGQSSGHRVGTISDSAASNVNVPSCLAVHNLVTSKLLNYYDKTYLDNQFSNATAQNLVLHQYLATRLPLGTGETSADDRYVRSTTLAGSYSDTTAMNSAISTALSSYTGNASNHFSCASMSVNNVVRFDGQSLSSGLFTFYGLGVKNSSGTEYLPVFASNLYLSDQYASHSYNNMFITAALDTKQALINNTNRLDSSLIADGSVDNTEFQYLNGVTTSIQTQLDQKLTETAGDARYLRYTIDSSTSTKSVNETLQMNTVTIANNLVVNGTISSSSLTALTTSNDALTTRVNVLESNAIDATPVDGSTNAIQSNYLYDIFYDFETGRTGQDNYVMATHQYNGKANFQLWHNWSGVVNATSAQTFNELLTALGLDTTNFYLYNKWPVNSNNGFTYWATSVPPIINTGANGESFKVDNTNVGDYILARWTFTTYVYTQGTYSFRLGADDGAKLLIRSVSPQDNEPDAITVCDLDSRGTYRTTTGSKLLRRGRLYEVQVMWMEFTSGHRCTLEWQRPQDTDYSFFRPFTPSPEFNYYQPHYSVTRTGTGDYTVVFGSTCLPQANNYTLVLTKEDSAGGLSIGYYSKSTTGFSVKIRNDGASGAVTDARFDFQAISRGRVFCHGSVSASGIADEEGNYG
jgi:hypothetical protein